MKNILDYFKSLFIPEVKVEFEPSEEDLSILNTIEAAKDEISLIEPAPVITPYEANLSKLLKIYEEADIILKDIEDSRRLNLKGVDYDISDTYQELIIEPSKVKISFLYFILKLIETPPRNTFTHFHKQFLSNIFNSIIATKVNLSNKDFENFILFENKNRLFYKESKDDYSFEAIDECFKNFRVDQSLILQKAAVYSYKKKLTEATLKQLREEYLLNRHPSVGRIFYNAKSIYRIFTNTKYVPNKIPFFLLTDYFGKKVNQLLLNSNDTKSSLFSEFLQSIATDKKLNDKQHQLIENMGVDFFTDTSIKILDLVAVYKSDLRLVCFWNGRKERYRKLYNRMFEENITVVFRLLTVLDELVLLEKLSSSTLIIIIERSYTHRTNIEFLGAGAVKIGNVCIKILASQLVENGEEALKNLYNKTKYKSLKKKITKELSK